MLRRLVLCCLMTAASAGFAQAPDQADARALLERIAQSMKRYSRDISEVPLTVEATVRKFDAQGKLTHEKTSTHTMEFVKRYVKGDRVVRQLRWNKSLFHWVNIDEANADSASSVMALLFDNGAIRDSHTYALEVHTKSRTVDLRVGQANPCEPFDPMNVSQRFWCGHSSLTLDLDTMMPLKATFDESGLPRDFGGTQYKRYHFDEEFQMVSIEGSRQPWLLPSRVIVSWETNHGRVEVESRFAVKSKPVSN